MKVSLSLSIFCPSCLPCVYVGHNERDKTGLPRLIEALQSVMWSNAQKKTVPKVKSFVPGDLNSLPPPPQKTLAGGAPENVRIPVL